MSLATAVGQVIFSQKSGVYMPAIMCNKGDLYQEYNGDSSNPVDISPDFTTLQPILSFVITSSRVAEGLVVPSSMKWYFNDTELTFGSNKISTNSFSGETGHFEFINYQAGVQNYYALRIKKNLVKAAGAAPCTIKGEATVAVGNTSDKIQYVYTIPITYGVGNSKRVTIQAGDNKYFTLTTQGDSCKLKAVARVGSDEITSGLTYKWYKLSNGAWSVISGQTGQTLTVTTDMVDTSGQFKAEVYQSGVMIGMDVQTVMDVSDPLDIILNRYRRMKPYVMKRTQWFIRQPLSSVAAQRSTRTCASTSHSWTRPVWCSTHPQPTRLQPAVPVRMKCAIRRAVMYQLLSQRRNDNDTGSENNRSKVRAETATGAYVSN